MVLINYSSPEFENTKSRQDFAIYVAKLMNNSSKSSCPYMLNDKDNFWTVDDANDWKIKFYNPNQVEIIHRYHNADALKALATWIAYRTCGEVEIIENH